MRILVLNGPNLNMLGVREPDIYGRTTYTELCRQIDEWAKAIGCEVTVEQSNHEGKLIDLIQDAYYDMYDGLVINPGAYTHYSYAIRDALAILHIPVIEVHISDIDAREDFRRHSVISDVCTATIKGEGINGYRHALETAVYQADKNK